MSEWKTKKTSEVFDLVNGFAFKSSEFLDEGIPVIKIKNVKAGLLKLESLEYVDSKYLSEIPEKLIKYDDLLVTMSGNRMDGSPETWVGKVARFNLTEPYFINQRVGILRIKNFKENCPRFMSYQLSSDIFQSHLIAIATSSGGQANLSAGQINSLEVTAPNIKIQREIGRILSSFDDKIELNRQMNRTLEQVARALFKSWFVDFDPVRAKMRGEVPEGMNAETAALFPDELVEIEGREVPKGWPLKQLKDVLELAYGKALKADTRAVGKIPVYGSNGPVGFHNIALVEGPGIIVGRKGNPGIVKWSSIDFFPIDTTFYVKAKSDSFSMEHAFYSLENLNLPSLSADSAVPGLNRDSAYLQDYIVPSAAILRLFDERMGILRNMLANLEAESTQLAQLRDALLPQLLSGEVDVADWEAALEAAPGGQA